MFSKRSEEKEYLDLGHYNNEEYLDCMSKLAKIGRYLGGDRASFKALDSLEFIPESILDVGCGAGAFARLLAKRYPKAQILGIDISKDAIQAANTQTDSRLFPNLAFEYRKNPSVKDLGKSFDVVSATLLCHHLTDEEIIAFIQESLFISKRAFIINDLHRHPMAYFFFRILAPIFFNNRLILHDGLVSIEKGFSQQDLRKYLSCAGLLDAQWTLTWNWAFRWVITISR